MRSIPGSVRHLQRIINARPSWRLALALLQSPPDPLPEDKQLLWEVKGGGAEIPVWSCNFGTIILRLRCTLIQTPSDLKVNACLKAHVEISRARFEGLGAREERGANGKGQA